LNLALVVVPKRLSRLFYRRNHTNSIDCIDPVVVFLKLSFTLTDKLLKSDFVGKEIQHVLYPILVVFVLVKYNELNKRYVSFEEVERCHLLVGVVVLNGFLIDHVAELHLIFHYLSHFFNI